MAGLKTIIALSFVWSHDSFILDNHSHKQTQVLAIGFLLVILSSALWKNYLPLLVVATYVIAPLPNWLCGRAANHDDFMESGGSGVVDFGRFFTGFLVVMGIGEFRDRKRGGLEDEANISNSSPDTICALRFDLLCCHAHECCWRFAHIRDYHQLFHVFPGRRGVLND
jgi:hypothetical protein